MTLYCNPSWKTTLQKQQLATFDQIWDFPIQWIDTPNQNRGGWSGVGCLEVLFGDKPVTLFVKKQLNHTTRTVMHPLQGVPTFAKEFKAIRFLRAHGVATPNVVFFGQCRTSEGRQAILITEILAGYQPLDVIFRGTLTLLQQRELLRCIAQTIRRMHKLGIQHRALYAKHIFVKPSVHSFDVALIDMEKCRRMVFPPLQSVADLITLNYRTTGWNRTSRLYFLKRYFGLAHLNAWYKHLTIWMYQKTLAKQKNKDKNE